MAIYFLEGLLCIRRSLDTSLKKTEIYGVYIGMLLLYIFSLRGLVFYLLLLEIIVIVCLLTDFFHPSSLEQ